MEKMSENNYLRKHFLLNLVAKTEGNVFVWKYKLIDRISPLCWNHRGKDVLQRLCLTQDVIKFVKMSLITTTTKEERFILLNYKVFC